MLKLTRKYLHWVQNSVFEGEISEVRIKEMLIRAKSFMNEKEDSIIVFKGAAKIYIEKLIVGKEVSSTDIFL